MKKNSFTASQKIKREILLQAYVYLKDIEGLSKKEREFVDSMKKSGLTKKNVDDQYDLLVESGCHSDYESEFRGGQFETDLPSPSSRHYESKEVASKLADGSWVGWTYWYGGGKHGDPDGIEWIEDAYDLECTEVEKMVVVREFKKV